MSIKGTDGTVVNLGSIASQAAHGVGVYIYQAAMVTNAAGASITGGAEGIRLGFARNAIPGTVTNAAAAVITGGTIAVDLYAGGTLWNAGTIAAMTGAGGTAVAFGGDGSTAAIGWC